EAIPDIQLLGLVWIDAARGRSFLRVADRGGARLGCGRLLEMSRRQAVIEHPARLSDRSAPAAALFALQTGDLDRNCRIVASPAASCAIQFTVSRRLDLRRAIELVTRRCR